MYAKLSEISEALRERGYKAEPNFESGDGEQLQRGFFLYPCDGRPEPGYRPAVSARTWIGATISDAMTFLSSLPNYRLSRHSWALEQSQPSETEERLGFRRWLDDGTPWNEGLNGTILVSRGTCTPEEAREMEKEFERHYEAMSQAGNVLVLRESDTQETVRFVPYPYEYDPNRFNMPDALEMVRENHKAFGVPVLDRPQLIPEDRMKFRVDLLKEELSELLLACTQGDLTEIADALVDLQYVLSGAVLEFGMGDKFRELFQNVHDSNMSKACTSLDEAEATQMEYARKGIQTYIEPIGLYFIVKRKDNTKYVKSVNYTPADLKPILDRE